MIVKAGLSSCTGWQRGGVRSWASGLIEWRGAVAGNCGPRMSGSAVTLLILGHRFLGSCVSPDPARWLT